MDDAFCGGGDTNIGLSDTSTPIQASALNKIAAAIFMGDPRHIPGLSYNVGTCNASGVSPCLLPTCQTLPGLNILNSFLCTSSLPVHRVSNAPARRRLNHTATPRILTAATETIRTLIKDTERSTVSRR